MSVAECFHKFISIGCKSNSERAEKMLELLREKGLEGEPSISKCKQLKVDYLTKREIEDLDPNLIIQTEGTFNRSIDKPSQRRILKFTIFFRSYYPP